MRGRLFSLGLLIWGLLLLAWTAVSARQLRPDAFLSPSNLPRSAVLFDANRVAVWVTNRGVLGRDPNTGIAGFFYPAGGGKTVLYAAGFWVAGKVDGQVRTACADYGSEYQPGVILPNGTADDPSKPRYRVYRIRRGDSADPASPNYNPDYAEWPVADGAPVDESGVPLVLGDQTLWCVMNDLDRAAHDQLYQSTPLGLEVRWLVWAFADTTSPLGQAVFLHITLVNRGPRPIEDAYVGFFLDPDVGFSSDDGTGCDTSLALTYAYNRAPTDEVYGRRVPAVGLVLLQGPAVPKPGEQAFQFLHAPLPDRRTLGITSNSVYYCGHTRFAQPRYGPGGAEQVYNNFLGRNIFGEPYVHPLTGQQTAFMNTGNPLLGTGWLDDLYTELCDVYCMQGTGPFTLAPLDTQRVAYAFLVAEGETHLSSTEVLKKNARFVRNAFRARFLATALASVRPVWTGENRVDARVRVRTTGNVASALAVFRAYDGTKIAELPLYDDGAHDDGEAGDGIWGGTWSTAAREEALYLDVRLTTESGRILTFDHAEDKITLNRAVSLQEVRLVGDDGNYDGKANPGENIRLVPVLANGLSRPLGAVGLVASSNDHFVDVPVRHLFLPGAEPGELLQMCYKVDDSTTFFELNVAPDAPDTHTVSFHLNVWDDLQHHWVLAWDLPVEPYPFALNELIPVHTAGISDARFRVRVVNPPALTGHAYVLTVSDSINPTGDKGFNLIDQTTGDTLLASHPAPDRHAYNVPVTDGFKVVEAYLPKGGLKDVTFREKEGGHPTAFAPVNVGGHFLLGGVRLGAAPKRRFYKVELEFTDAIDANGVVGFPSGQKAYRYEVGQGGGPTAFVPSPFKAWKVIRGARVGLLNVCYTENPHLPTYDGQWAPDTSRFGGLETLYIMATDYDSSGATYEGRSLPQAEVLYEVHLRLRSSTSVVDPGDALLFNWEYEATAEDRFEFVPTGVTAPQEERTPRQFVLYQNYPNPFNQRTVIRFELNTPGFVCLRVYNVIGQVVKTLVQRRFPTGTHEIAWDGTDETGRAVGSGVYIVELTRGHQVRRVKALVLR